jgi:hypothetical protein
MNNLIDLNNLDEDRHTIFARLSICICTQIHIILLTNTYWIGLILKIDAEYFSDACSVAD